MMKAYSFGPALALLLGATTACGTAPENDSTPTPTAVAPVAPTTLYLLRHADKQTGPEADPDDPALTPAGEARARQLAEVFSATDLDAVYSTPYVRARETFSPLATLLGQEVRVYDPDLDLRRLVDSLVELHAGGRIAIVGHGPTIPGMLNALTASEDYPTLADDDVEGVYRVVVLPQGVLPEGEVIVDELRIPYCTN